MRIYLPATLDEINPPTTGDGPGGRLALTPRIVHAVTPALQEALPDEDEEGWEYAAQLAAADESLVLIAERPQAPRLRLVLAVDVPDDAVAPSSDEEALPSERVLTEAVPLDTVVCAHVDEPAAAADVEGCLAGDDDATERLLDRDLLWYDASELAAIPR